MPSTWRWILQYRHCIEYFDLNLQKAAATSTQMVLTRDKTIIQQHAAFRDCRQKHDFFIESSTICCTNGRANHYLVMKGIQVVVRVHGWLQPDFVWRPSEAPSECIAGFWCKSGNGTQNMEGVVLLVTQCGHVPGELVYSSLNVLKVLPTSSQNLSVLPFWERTGIHQVAICTGFPFWYAASYVSSILCEQNMYDCLIA